MGVRLTSWQAQCIMDASTAYVDPKLQKKNAPMPFGEGADKKQAAASIRAAFRSASKG